MRFRYAAEIPSSRAASACLIPRESRRLRNRTPSGIFDAGAWLGSWGEEVVDTAAGARRREPADSNPRVPSLHARRWALAHRPASSAMHPVASSWRGPRKRSSVPRERWQTAPTSRSRRCPDVRAHNFSAGPAGLPLPALEEAKAELLDFEETGMSILEQSHRAAPYAAVHAEVMDLLRKLANVPDTHDILLLQGGASLQFAMVPMNFLPPGRSADYLVTGVWGQKALAEASRVGRARTAADPIEADGRYLRLPTPEELR